MDQVPQVLADSHGGDADQHEHSQRDLEQQSRRQEGDQPKAVIQDRKSRERGPYPPLVPQPVGEVNHLRGGRAAAEHPPENPPGEARRHRPVSRDGFVAARVDQRAHPKTAHQDSETGQKQGGEHADQQCP